MKCTFTQNGPNTSIITFTKNIHLKPKYIEIPDHIKYLDIKNFRSQIKTYILTSLDPYSLPLNKNDDDTELDSD